MKKSKFSLKTFAFSLAIAANLILPFSVNGQSGRSDGFFNGGSGDLENRDGEPGVSGNISNDNFNAPLGNGLLVMAVAGACYVAVKRKAFKLMIAAAVMLGTTQCKKDVIPYNKKAYNITLDVDGGSRTSVNTETGEVLFVDGDEIIVANGGCYVGKLVYEDGAFSGTITGASDDDYLHFYHLGNRDTGTLTEGSDTECSVSIADQTRSLPVISYAPSDVKFSEETSTYTARLQNKCALVKFDVSNMSQYAGTCITGMRNKVTVDFSDASFEFTEENDGKITLASGSGERWAILLPQPLAAAGVEGSAFSGAYSGTRASVPEIKENDYLPEGISVVVETKVIPQGAKEGLFTINSDGRQVHFAQGNLVYNKVTDKWYFHEKQYHMFYMVNSAPGVDCENVDDIEYFGWGTSGFNHGAVYYQPWRTLKTNSCYYAYGDVAKNLYDEDGTADWGYNVVDNGGGAYKQWRVLTLEEQNFLFNSREGASDKSSYATLLIQGNEYAGMVVLPDEWTEPYDGWNYTPGVYDNYTTNRYNTSEWAKMEERGAVFLPCSGRRSNNYTVGVNLIGFYWSGDATNANNAYCVSFAKSGLVTSRDYVRSNGSSVRLLIE